MAFQPSFHPGYRPTRRRKYQGGLHPWTLAIGVLVVVIGVWMFNRNHNGSAADEATTIRERCETIITGMRNHAAPPPYDASVLSSLPSGDWAITAIDVVGWHGRSLVSIGSPASNGTSTRTTWEFRWSKRTLGGWTCSEILNVNEQAEYDPLGWQK